MLCFKHCASNGGYQVNKDILRDKFVRTRHKKIKHNYDDNDSECSFSTHNLPALCVSHVFPH